MMMGFPVAHPDSEAMDVTLAKGASLERRERVPQTHSHRRRSFVGLLAIINSGVSNYPLTKLCVFIGYSFFSRDART